MSQIRLLVGTRKGAFILTSDGKRQNWKVEGPHFAGWEIYHVKGSPADPNRLYASQSSGWFGQQIQRSDDGGKTWNPVGNKFGYDGVPGTHEWYDGTPHPWEFKRVWHLEPSLSDPDTLYAGVEDAALFRSTDAGQNWHELSGLRTHTTGSAWTPAPAACASTPSSSIPQTPTASSSPSPPPAPSAPTMAARPGSPSTRASAPPTSPIPPPKSATASIASPCIPANPTPSSCRNTGTSCAPTTPATNGIEVSGNLPTDFGFVIDIHAHEPETIYVVPIKSDGEHFPLDGKLQVFRSKTGGNEWEPLTKGLPQSDCYVNVLRDAMAVDTLDSCGIYFGTTGGQVYASSDSGDSWAPIVRDLPAVLSVEVQTLA